MIDFSENRNVRIETLLSTSFYTEGPVVDASGRYFFTTLAGGTIMCLENEGNVSSWALSACPNGQAITAGGDHLICDSRTGTLKRFGPDGILIRDEVVSTCAGVAVGVPNDVVADSYGGFYFTDSIRFEGKLFYKGMDGAESLVASALDYPNGLVLTADGKYLLLSESYANRILKFKLAGPGRATTKSVLADLPRHASGDPVANLPDGMALDREHRLWVAHYGMGVLQILGETGERLGAIETGMPLTSNVCFLPGKELAVLVTGGFGEPGPGALLRITVTDF